MFLDQSELFWRKFSQNIWQKSPVLIKKKDRGGFPKITPEELFRAVLKCCEEFSAGASLKVRFFADGRQIDIKSGRHFELLPREEDINFVGYNERIENTENISEYALIIADWHQKDRVLWERILPTVKAISNQVGITSSRMDTQVFIGNYKRTPFGVHVDSASAFHIPIIGKKVMRFWKNNFASKCKGLHHSQNYEQFKKDSFVIETNLGEINYWPSDYWHIGESSGEFAVTWRFGYWIDDGMHKYMARLASHFFNELPNLRMKSLPETETIENFDFLPMDEIISSFSTTVTALELREKFARVWLEHCSAWGFLVVPKNIQLAPNIELMAFRLKPIFRLYSGKVSEHSVAVAAAGQSIVFQSNQAIPLIIAEINSGGTVSLDYLSSIFGNRELILNVLKFCVSNGIMEIVKPSLPVKN